MQTANYGRENPEVSQAVERIWAGVRTGAREEGVTGAVLLDGADCNFALVTCLGRSSACRS